MRKLLALAAAAGLAIALSSPVTAATIDFSAAKKKVDCSMEKNKMNKACKGKTSDVGSVDLSAAKKKKKVKMDCSVDENKMQKACKGKERQIKQNKTDLGAFTFSAAKKKAKVDCTMAKNKMNKACKGKM